MKKNKPLIIGLFVLLTIITKTEALPVLFSGMQIEITAQANNGKVAVNNSGTQLVATDSEIQRFFIIKNFDGTYSFQSEMNGNFITADYNLSPPYLVANRTKIDIWEKFQLIDNGDNTFSLKSYDGSYICADLNLNQTPILAANRTEIGLWEKFTMKVTHPLNPASFGTYQASWWVQTFGLPSESYAAGHSNTAAYSFNTFLSTSNYPTEIKTYNDAGFNFSNINHHFYEIKYIASHGNDGKILMADNQYAFLRSNSIVLSGYTKYLFCFSDATLFTGNKAPFDATPYMPCFKGAHAILGHVGNVFYYSMSRPAVAGDEFIPFDFCDKWTNEGQTLFDAWKNSNFRSQYVSGIIPGTGPAIVFTIGDLYGNNNTPVHYSGYEEKYQNMYTGGTYFSEQDQANYPCGTGGEVLIYNPLYGYPKKIGHKWAQMGNPDWNGIVPLP